MMQTLWRKLPLFLVWALLGCVTTAEKKIVYRVQVEEGDTLASIAAHFDTTWTSVAALNRQELKNGGLRVGQVLTVHPGPHGLAATVSTSRPFTTKSKASLNKEKSYEEEDLVIDEESDEEPEALPRKNRGKGLLFGGADGSQQFIFPVNGSVTSPFGPRGRRFHKGIDLRGSLGTPIRAASAGEVTFVGRQRGYGRTVVVDHGTYATLYAHCSKIIAHLGDTVKGGDYIAKVGITGNAKGPHLHFEIRDHYNKPLDPMGLLSRKLVSFLDLPVRTLDGPTPVFPDYWEPVRIIEAIN